MGYSTQVSDAVSRIVFNSRGEETIEVEIHCGKLFGRAAAPSGASRGRGEVQPFPPGGIRSSRTVFYERIRPKLIGMDCSDQRSIDKLLHEIDASENFRTIGGALAYAVSLAAASVAAIALSVPLYKHLSSSSDHHLPIPLGNVLGGGKHTGTGSPDIQEFLVLPYGAKDLHGAIRTNFMVHAQLGQILKKSHPLFTGGRGDEGGYSINSGNIEALEAVTEAALEVADKTGTKIGIGLDMAASSFWSDKDGKYFYARENVSRNREEQLSYVLSLIEDYELAYVEDPVHEGDLDGFAYITSKTKQTLICGDDLIVTRKENVREATRRLAVNAIIVKPNQVGTITDASECAAEAASKGIVTVASHRSGETSDAHLSHLAVALGCKLVKSGTIGGERVSKANELIRISETFEGASELARLGWT